MSVDVWKEQNKTIETLRHQLAESQAREATLREALVEVQEFVLRVTHWEEGCYDRHGALQDCKKALALPADDAALRDAIAKCIERNGA